MSFICTRIKIIFINMALHLALLWNRQGSTRKWPMPKKKWLFKSHLLYCTWNFALKINKKLTIVGLTISEPDAIVSLNDVLNRSIKWTVWAYRLYIRDSTTAFLTIASDKEARAAKHVGQVTGRILAAKAGTNMGVRDSAHVCKASGVWTIQ